MVTTVAEELDKARALVEQGWTQGQFARDKNGQMVDPRSEMAVSWCAAGALDRAEASKEAFDAFYEAISARLIVDWNDAFWRTQSQVIDAFKRAAQIARKRAE